MTAPVSSEEKISGSRYYIRKDVTPDGEPIYVLYRYSWCFGQEAHVEKARNKSKHVLETAKHFLENDDD